MWFKNLQVYRLPAPWAMTAQKLEESLQRQAFTPCTSLDLQSQGWIAPRDDGALVHTVNRQMLILLGTEKKLLPASVINQVTKARAIELEEQQGFAPGRKQLRELKERIADELLPRAFSMNSQTHVWIDPINGWLVIDSGSTSKADEVFKLLLKSVDTLPVESLRTNRSPQSCMTEWLATDEAPAGFTVDQDTELRAAGESKATVRYVRHTVEVDEVQRHIAAGKQCTRLAMSWSDRVSFVLTESLAIKRIAPLDILLESPEGNIKNDAERFDSDFLLMTGEFNKMLSDLVEALGGEFNNQSDLVQRAAQADEDDGDQLYEQAVAIVMSNQRASVSMVQRHLRIAYNRAARLLESMEKNGLLGALQADGSREILKAA